MTDHLDRNLGLELVRLTEAAALAAGRWIGKGATAFPMPSSSSPSPTEEVCIIRQTSCILKLIFDGDVAGALTAAIEDYSGVDMLM